MLSRTATWTHRSCDPSAHCSDKYEGETHPDTGAEVETHPKNLVSPVFTCTSHLAAHESIFQSVTNPEIAQTSAPTGVPTRYVVRDIHKHDQGGRPGGSNQTDNNPQG